MNSDEFKQAMMNLPEPPGGGRPPYWSYWRNLLWNTAKNDTVDNFMNWPVVRHNMLVSHLSVDWAWDLVGDSSAVIPPAVGQPMDYYRDIYSRNMVWQAGYLAAWERASGKRVASLNHILEFGGGFGAMALLCRRLGFAGRYVIYDFPELGLLQRWFLEANDQTADYWSEFRPTHTDLFIALASLSESPLEQRAKIMPLLECDNFIFYYPPRYEDIDNQKWFENFAEFRSDLHWQAWQLPGSDIWIRVGWK